MSKQRLRQEFADYLKDPIPGCTVEMAEGGRDIMNWKATLRGPAGSPYEGGTFKMDIRFHRDYPFRAPAIKFETTIFHPNIDRTPAVSWWTHPNIDRTGKPCLDMLDGNWSPNYTTAKVLMSMMVLLSEPNPENAVYADAADLYRSNRTEFNNRAREFTLRYAMG